MAIRITGEATYTRPVLRALFVSPRASLDGGAAVSLIELLEALAVDEQFELVLAVPGPGRLVERAARAGVEVRVTPTATWLSRAFAGRSLATTLRRVRYGAQVLGRVRAMRRLLRDVRPDVVVTNTIDSPVAALAARTADVPHVWWVREFGRLDSLKHFLLGERASYAVLDATATRVVTVSSALAEHVEGFIGSGKVGAIHPAVVVAPGPPSSPPAPGEPLRLLLLGRIIPAKGHDVLLQALARLDRETVDVHVRIVGDGDHAFTAALHAQSRRLGLDGVVEFVPRSDALVELDATHALLMCSGNEAFGRVTAEALERGRPVIAAGSGGTLDMVRDGENGLLFTPGSAASLADAVTRLATTAGLLATLTAGARASGSGWGSPATAAALATTVLTEAAATSWAGSWWSWSSWRASPAWRRR
jgi:glycosyltransferase involved in cell wall biosynthesis